MLVASRTHVRFRELEIRRHLMWLPVALTLTATPVAHAVRNAGPSSTFASAVQPPRATAAPDTTLCGLISAKEFFGALKAPVGTVKAKMGAVRGAQMVTCAYLPPGRTGAGGSITYMFPANATSYFAQLREEYKTILNKETDLNGIGTAAFWGTDKDSEDALELNMRQGNVVVGLLLNGKSADASVLLPAAQQMAKEIAAHFQG